MKLVYMDEINKSNEILQKRFKRIDEHDTGIISIRILKRILKETCLLTPKEINGLVRSIKGTEDFKYEEFKEKLFNVRLELAKSRILETNIDKVQTHIITEC